MHFRSVLTTSVVNLLTRTHEILDGRAKVHNDPGIILVQCGEG